MGGLEVTALISRSLDTIKKKKGGGRRQGRKYTGQAAEKGDLK